MVRSSRRRIPVRLTTDQIEERFYQCRKKEYQTLDEFLTEYRYSWITANRHGVTGL